MIPRAFRRHFTGGRTFSSHTSNLKHPKPDAILFRNGYASNAPEMLVEFRGLRRCGNGRNAYYAIRLGKILRMKRWQKKAATRM
jgi:hypothetical protein